MPRGDQRGDRGGDQRGLTWPLGKLSPLWPTHASSDELCAVPLAALALVAGVVEESVTL